MHHDGSWTARVWPARWYSLPLSKFHTINAAPFKLIFLHLNSHELLMTRDTGKKGWTKIYKSFLRFPGLVQPIQDLLKINNDIIYNAVWGDAEITIFTKPNKAVVLLSATFISGVFSTFPECSGAVQLLKSKGSFKRLQSLDCAETRIDAESI